MGFYFEESKKMVTFSHHTKEGKRMLRFKLKYLSPWFLIGYLITLITTSAFAQTNSVSTEFVLFYKNEFTFLLCILTMILGTWLGVKIPTKAGEVELSKGIKIVAGILGGLLAFIYCLQKDKGLTLMNPIWIAVACVALPLTIITLRDRLIAYAKVMKYPKDGG